MPILNFFIIAIIAYLLFRFLFEKKKNIEHEKLSAISISFEEKFVKNAERGLDDIIEVYMPDLNGHTLEIIHDKIMHVFTSGQRSSSLENFLKQYVSPDKVKPLARHSLSFLYSKYRQAKCEDLGVTQYRWSNSHEHCHKWLDRKIFYYNDPPIANNKGFRANPGELDNCSCLAVPIIE